MLLWKVCFIPLYPLLAFSESYFMSQWVFVLSVSFFFPHPSLSLLPSSFHLAMLPPLFMWQRNSCLVQGVRLARQAGCRLCRARTLSSLSLARTPTHTHSHTFLPHSHTSRTVTSIHIHLKARQEGVGSWTHISWVSIEVYQCELWRLELEELRVTSMSLKHFLSNFPENPPYTYVFFFCYW